MTIYAIYLHDHATMIEPIPQEYYTSFTKAKKQLASIAACMEKHTLMEVTITDINVTGRRKVGNSAPREFYIAPINVQ